MRRMADGLCLQLVASGHRWAWRTKTGEQGLQVGTRGHAQLLLEVARPNLSASGEKLLLIRTRSQMEEGSPFSQRPDLWFEGLWLQHHRALV